MDDQERRMRRAAVTRLTHHVPEPEPPEDDQPTEDDAPARRMEQQALWVDLQVRRAMERGDFDNLPGAGKPLKLPETHDPDWWVKSLIAREQITGVAPAAIALRREDAELDDVLDRESTEHGVRRVLDDFNQRVVEARRQLLGGPPVVTPTREVEKEVAAWRARRAERLARVRRQGDDAPATTPRRRWWRRR
jgi:hypothetical protein